MKDKYKYAIDIIVAIIGVVGGILGGTTILDNTHIQNVVENNSSVEVNVTDSAGDIALKLLEQNEELRIQIDTLTEQNEQLQKDNLELQTDNQDERIGLQEDYNALVQELESVTEERDRLQSEYNALKNNWNQQTKTQQVQRQQMERL